MTEILDNLKKASKAWLEAKKVADKLVKPGESILEIATKVENKVLETANLAFPLNISRNHEAAHYSPLSDCKEVIRENDMVKIDIGAQVDGYIVDAAYTIYFGDQHKDLVKASKSGLETGLKYISKNKSESSIGELGKIIEDAIKKFDAYKPIYNLTGHSMERYNLHAGKSIMNCKTNNNNTLGQGFFAIEPFATNGSGLIKDGGFCSIYSAIEGNTRQPSSRTLLEDSKRYRGLPFSERWIGKKLSSFEKNVALGNLIQSKIFKPHPMLVERNGSNVSQHEKTVYIDEKDKVYIFPDIEY